MITLALDTTGSWCSVALVDEARILEHKGEKIGRGHAERLAPMVDEVFKLAALGPNDIERIAVCTGPGSFTGLRVALAFARSFALPGKIPVLGISNLRALAFQIDPENQKRIASVINVKRGEICWAGYDKGIEVSPPTTSPAEIAKKNIEQFSYDLVTGDGAPVIGLTPDGQTHISAAVLGWISQDLPPANYPPDPLYSRAPDAKLPGGITP